MHEPLQQVRCLLFFCLVRRGAEHDADRVAGVRPHLGDPDGYGAKAGLLKLGLNDGQGGTQQAVIAGGVAVPVEVENVHILPGKLRQDGSVARQEGFGVSRRKACRAADEHLAVGAGVLDGGVGQRLELGEAGTAGAGPGIRLVVYLPVADGNNEARHVVDAVAVVALDGGPDEGLVGGAVHGEVGAGQAVALALRPYGDVRQDVNTSRDGAVLRVVERPIIRWAVQVRLDQEPEGVDRRPVPADANVLRLDEGEVGKGAHRGGVEAEGGRLVGKGRGRGGVRPPSGSRATQEQSGAGRSREDAQRPACADGLW